MRAVAWLNEASSGSFYLLKVEAVKIGGSAPAPLFTVIVGPSEESKRVGEAKKELAERYVIRRRFWEGLLARAKPKSSLHAGRSPTSDNWLGTSAGRSGLDFNYIVRKHDADVQLDIYLGRDSETKNRVIFDDIRRRKEDVEAEFGAPLDWQPKDGIGVCTIKNHIDIGGYADEEKWPQIHDAMIDAMTRLEKALRPHIERIK